MGDPLGQMGIRLSPNSATQVWARKLANGDVAVALYNRGGTTKSSDGASADITCNFAMAGIDLPSTVSVFDIWAKKALGTFTSTYTATAVPFHGTAFLRLSPINASPT